MARGRNYYNPITQAPDRVEPVGERRIELYPEGDVRDNAERPKWIARLVGEDGLVVQYSPGSFDHNDALRQAQELWPGLDVFELREESEDSTHEGFGPSPRLWQNASPQMGFPGEAIPKDVPPAVATTPRLHVAVVPQAGIYILLDDFLATLEDYAAQFDGDNNPSAALGLREAASALREAF